MLFQIELDPWLTSIMGRPAYDLKRLQSGGADPMEIAVRLANEGAFATVKVPIKNISQVNNLVIAGFRVVDIALNFAINVEFSKEPVAVRNAIDTDENRVREIASSAFRFSRFHLDPFVSVSIANRIKSDWAGNFFKGLRGDAMLIAEVDGKVAGFCQLIFRDSRAVIDLIAVDPSFSRRGLGRSLLASISGYAATRSMTVKGLVVGTQAANTPSVNLYESFGFRLVGSHMVLHSTSHPLSAG